jgi:uncharacterized protein (TIRG00374 family)
MKIGLNIAISGILIGVIVWMLGGPHEIGALILQIDPFYIVPIIALFMLDRALMAYRWCLLLRGRGIQIPFLHGMMVYCASAIWGLFLPTTVGSDAVRAYTTSRAGFGGRVIVASIIVERVIGFLSSLILVVLSLGLLTQLGYLKERVMVSAWLLGCGTLLAVLCLVVASLNQSVSNLLHDTVLYGLRSRRFAQKLRDFHETYRSFAADRWSLALPFVLTLAAQVLIIADTWLIARGMKIEVGALYLGAALPLALLIARLPISIDGIGVYEGVFVVLMSLAGLSAAQAMAISVATRILATTAYIPWWAAHVLSMRSLRRGSSSQSVRTVRGQP